MKFQSLYGPRLKIKLLYIKVRLTPAGSPTGVVPTGCKAVAGIETSRHGVFALRVKFKTALYLDLILVVVRRLAAICIFDEMIAVASLGYFFESSL